MPKFTIDQLIDYIGKWVVTGELNEAMLADNFHFVSPYWKSYDKPTFIEKFRDPTEYQQKSLSNILRFEPIFRLKSDDHRNFSIIFQYHTKYGISVDEAVLGTIENGLIVELRSIYDLEKTKQAHQL
ncbi:MAG: hypothetical protein EXR81_06190 [Gammaproteobacteria bacterium]|nr:hypothetical protein [Gammaproteobacteria bacterium]